MNRILCGLLLFCSLACTPRPKAPNLSSEEGTAVGKVGDLVITDKALMERVAAIEKTYPRAYAAHVQKKELLNQMMNIEVLYEAALAQGLDKSFEFKSRMADLYVQRLAEAARAKIGDREVKQYFDDHREEIEQISARHILLKTDSHQSAAEKKSIREKIAGLRDQLLKAPEKFPEFAAQYSEDGSKSNRGELGFFSRGMMVAPFSKAAFALKKIGDISPVVETQFGFHIIQLSGEKRSIDDYREKIKDVLLRQTQRGDLDQVLAKLRSHKKIEIYEDNLAKLSPLPKEISTPPEDLVPKDLPVNDGSKPLPKEGGKTKP